MKFSQSNISMDDLITTRLTGDKSNKVLFTEAQWCAVPNDHPSGGGWRRIPYNKIIRNLTTEFANVIDELVELD